MQLSDVLAWIHDHQSHAFRENTVRGVFHTFVGEIAAEADDESTFSLVLWLNPHRLAMLADRSRERLISRLLDTGSHLLEEYGIAALSGAVRHVPDTQEICLTYTVTADSPDAVDALREDFEDARRHH